MYLEFKRDFVYYTQVPNHQKIKERLLTTVKEQEQSKESWPESNAETSYFKEKNNQILRESYILDSIAYEPMDQMLAELGEICPESTPAPTGSFVHSIWYTIYHQGQHQEIHNHGPACNEIRGGKEYHVLYSGIYILEMPENVRNTTVFTRARPQFGNVVKVDRENINTAQIEDIKEGTVLLFPYYMDHFVQPLEEYESRVTIAFNIMSTFT